MSHQRNIFLLTFLILSSKTFAGDSLTPISVTASRTPVSIEESGGSITIVNQQDIENRQVPYVSDLLRDVPGAAISQSGGVGTVTQLRLRGAEANHTLVRIDGIEANDIALGAEFNFANLLTCGIERIEILRGPQSSLWGSDALSGVVNVQTRKGSGPLQVESTFSGGNFDTRQNCSGISGGNDFHHFSLFGSHLENNGTNISEQGSEDDGYRNTSLNFRYGITPFENFEVNLSGRHVDAAVETDPFDPPVDGNRETQTVQNYFIFNTLLDTYNGAWKHQANISITDTDNENYADNTQISSTIGEKLKFDYQTSLFHSTDNTEHSLTLAYERERERFEQTGIASIFGDPNQRQKIYNNSYVAEYRTGFFEKLFLSASVRKDDNDEFKNRSTHKISATFTPSSINSSFHASYGTGIKNPTFTERFGFAPDTFVGNSDLKPEKSKGWEAGISHSFSNQFEVSATYFSEELEDEINGFFFDPSLGLFGSFTAINLEGESDRKGIELSFNTQVMDGLNIQGTYSYVDSVQPNATGKTTEIRVPKTSASLIANYRFLSEKANLNLRINYTDDQFDNDFSTFPANRVELGDYTLVNIAGEYQVSNWIVIEGRVENLFNKQYQDVFGYETQGINSHIGIKFQSTH